MTRCRRERTTGLPDYRTTGPQDHRTRGPELRGARLVVPLSCCPVVRLSGGPVVPWSVRQSATHAMDRKSIIVLVICGLLFLLWAQLVPRLYPPPAAPHRTNQTAVTVSTNLPTPQ